MTSISNTNPTRAGLKLHRENFAEFKEGVLGRMESKANPTAKVIMMKERRDDVDDVTFLRMMMKTKARTAAMKIFI